jgi:hypothetical protein
MKIHFMHTLSIYLHGLQCLKLGIFRGTILTLPKKTTLAMSISAAMYLWAMPNAISGEVSQKVTFDSSGQSMWGTGSSIAFSNLANPLFLGAEWEKSGKIFEVGTASYGSNGLKVTGATSGRIGLETGWEIDSGTINSSLPFEFTFALPDFSDLNNGEAFSMGVVNSKLLGGAFLESISPTVQTYVDFILEADASVTAKGCYDVWVDTDCGSKKKSLFNIDESFELLALNRDKDGEVRILDGFSSLFAAGESVASVVEVTNEVDPDDPEGRKKKKVSIDLKPKVSVGSSPLVEVDVRLPDIVEKEYLGTGISISSSGANNVLSTSGSDNFLDISLDVDQLGTSLGILPPLGVTADVDFGIGSVSASVDLIDLTLTPSLALTQDFSLSIGNIGISYAFDEAVFAGMSGGPLSSVTRLDDLNLNQQIDVTWTDGKNLGITPIFAVDVSLTNKTGLRIDTTFNIDLVKGSISGEVFGIDMGSSKFGPLATIPFDLGSIELPPLFDSSFALAGFDGTAGNKLLFSTDNLEFKAGRRDWNDKNSWEDGNIPLINNVTIRNHNNDQNHDTVAYVTSASQSGALNIYGLSGISIGNNGVLTVGGDFIHLDHAQSSLNVSGNGLLKLGATDMDITGEGVLQLSGTSTLTSINTESQVRFDGANISSWSGNSTISNIALELKNGSTITASNSHLSINGASISGDGKTTLSTFNSGSIALNSTKLENLNLDGEFYVGDKNNTQCVWPSEQAGCILYQNKNTVEWKAGESGVISLEGSIESLSQTDGGREYANIKTLVLDGLVEGNTLVNNGEIIIATADSGSFPNSFGVKSQSNLVVKQDYTFTGNGSVVLFGEQSEYGDGARISGGSGVDLINGTEHTITGNGSIGGFASIDNQGQIIANGGELYMNNSSLVNNGELTARNNGTLRISNVWTNNGKVEAIGTGTVLNQAQLGAGPVNLSNLSTSTDAITLTGGQWQASNGGSISLGTEAASSNFSTFNNSADITLDGWGSNMTVGKSLDEFAVFNNQQDGLLTIKNGNFFDPDNIQNFGTINLVNGSIQGLQNNVDGLVQGFGGIELSAGAGEQVINYGTIRAEGGDLQISYAASSSDTFINKGRIEVMGGASLEYQLDKPIDGLNASTFDGNGGTWAAYADDRAAQINFKEGYSYDDSQSVASIKTLTNVDVILSGEKANLSMTTLSYFFPTTEIDLQESLGTISATATLTLANDQQFTATNNITNQGQITLQDASLAVDTLTNSGTVSGHGDLLTTSIDNSGVLSASGGQLNLRQIITNTGTIQTGDEYGDVLHLNAANITGGKLNVAENGLVNGTGSLRNVLMNNQGKIVSDTYAMNLNLASGSTNSGTMEATSGVLALEGASLQNAGGLIAANANSEVKLKGITVLSGAVSVVGNGSVLSGYGTLDNIALQISEGTITANVDGQRLTLDPGEAAQLMRATLRAENGGILLLTEGEFNNGGGTLIQAREGSVVEIKNISMNGGRLETIGDGKIVDLGSSDFTDMSFNANTEVANGGEFNLYGTIINTSSLTALDGGEIVLHDAKLSATTLKTITHPDGTVSFEPVASDGELNIEAGGTFKGEGRVEELALDNQGTIHADGSKALIFDLKGDLFVNNGDVEVTGAGGMQILDNKVENNGIVNVESTLTVMNELTQKSGELNVNGELVAQKVTIDKGSLAGSGLVDADVTVNEEGKIGRGSLILMQDLDLFGTLEIDMGDSGLYSMLDVRGDVKVGSSTQFELLFEPDYDPLAGLDFDFAFLNDFINFDVLSAASFIVKGLSDGFDWEVLWDDTSGGFSVDIFDVQSPNTDVPEPTTIMLLFFGVAFLVLRRKEPAPKRKEDELK